MVDALQVAPPKRTGLPMRHYPLLTEAIGGLRGITVIGGPTKNGKSRLAANIVANVGGPELPVLYLDMENDDQIDEQGEPLTVTVGHWIAEAYGHDCPALPHMRGYYLLDDLKHDLTTFDGPVLIVIDTVQSLVGQSGDRMRTDLVALVEWAKEQVRRGHLVMLISQVNDAGEFKESKSLKEGGWTSLTVKKTGDTVEVRVGNVRHRAISTKGIVFRMDGPRLHEVRALGMVAKDENGSTVALTPLQKAIVKHGDRISFNDLMRACGYSLKRDSASRKRGLRAIASAIEAREIGHPERDVYTYPAQTSGDKTEDIVSSLDVPTSSDGNPREDGTNQS